MPRVKIITPRIAPISRFSLTDTKKLAEPRRETPSPAQPGGRDDDVFMSWLAGSRQGKADAEKQKNENKIIPSGAESSRAFLAYAASELTTIEERKKALMP